MKNQFPVCVSLDHTTLLKLDRLAALTGHNRSSLLRCLISAIGIVLDKIQEIRNPTPRWSLTIC